MPFSNRNAIARRLVDIAGEAGQVLLETRSEGYHTSIKEDGSPVTSADLASEAIILRGLKAAFPDIPIVSEENVASHTLDPGSAFFLVDPLDGTKGFLGAGPDFCVLIALIVAGAPIAAAIDAPALGKRAFVGESAFRLVEGVFAPIPVPSLRPMGERIAIISAHHARGDTEQRCKDFGASVILFEHSALKFLRLAEGDADFYLRDGPTMQWDIGAGDAFIRATGGGVFTRNGQLLPYGPGAMGWTNPGFFALARPGSFAPYLV
jgi:3'(2'), 5'-bisphosphate nucleotidase